MRVFAATLDQSELHLGLKLEPGDCIVFDNTRVLHAHAFEGGSGARHLQGCYADLDGLASTVAVLERDALASIERTFLSAAGMAYLGEGVTMIEHQLQAAELAAGCSDALVVAALLHDIGHVIDGDTDAAEAMADDRDADHDASGAQWLSHWFGPDVTEPVRLHVAAKRYLVG